MTRPAENLHPTSPRPAARAIVAALLTAQALLAAWTLTNATGRHVERVARVGLTPSLDARLEEALGAAAVIPRRLDELAPTGAYLVYRTPSDLDEVRITSAVRSLLVDRQTVEIPPGVPPPVAAAEPGRDILWFAIGADREPPGPPAGWNRIHDEPALTVYRWRRPGDGGGR